MQTNMQLFLTYLNGKSFIAHNGTVQILYVSIEIKNIAAFS